jgi:ribosome-associated heat shock protein Hsp15
MSGDSVRADVWLWRARFFKSRSLAARFLDEGRVRLTREGAESRIDKCARPLRAGDHLVFAVGERVAGDLVAEFDSLGAVVVRDHHVDGQPIGMPRQRILPEPADGRDVEEHHADRARRPDGMNLQARLRRAAR